MHEECSFVMDNSTWKAAMLNDERDDTHSVTTIAFFTFTKQISTLFLALFL